MPEVKHAELIGGVVYMPSPVSRDHKTHDTLAIGWLSYYAAQTAGCEAGNDGTWLMLEDAPQPDSYLRILPEYGGQSSEERGYGSGAPELIVEVALTSAARDLGPKLRLYGAAGVPEYITVLVKRPQVLWRRLVSGAYSLIEPDEDGILRSAVFPGLWLDSAALLGRDIPRVLEVLEQGLRSPSHQEFVQRLGAGL